MTVRKAVGQSLFHFGFVGGRIDDDIRRHGCRSVATGFTASDLKTKIIASKNLEEARDIRGKSGFINTAFIDLTDHTSKGNPAPVGIVCVAGNKIRDRFIRVGIVTT